VLLFHIFIIIYGILNLMNSYLSETAFYELRENKSRFLAYVFPVTNKQAVNNYLQKLKALGYTRLGVIFESFNPSGSGFWLKHFTAYTHSVVRRIDEYAISKWEAAL